MRSDRPSRIYFVLRLSGSVILGVASLVAAVCSYGSYRLGIEEIKLERENRALTERSNQIALEAKRITEEASRAQSLRPVLTLAFQRGDRVDQGFIRASAKAEFSIPRDRIWGDHAQLPLAISMINDGEVPAHHISVSFNPGNPPDPDVIRSAGPELQVVNGECWHNLTPPGVDRMLPPLQRRQQVNLPRNSDLDFGAFPLNLQAGTISRRVKWSIRCLEGVYKGEATIHFIWPKSR